MSSKKCENCGTLIIKQYGSGRFCGEKCARSFATKAKREQINKAVSVTMKKLCISGEVTVPRNGGIARHQQKMSSPVRFCPTKAGVSGGINLDITWGDLEEYRKQHPVCEICGRTRPVDRRLCIDHDHRTNHFRGLLCSQCNRALGWFEKNQSNILEYLRR